MNKPEIYANERIDAMNQHGLQIVQSPEVFSFGIDAVLLADFAQIPRRGLIVDLCAGNGAVGLFASQKTQADIVEIELQDRLADMAQRSIELNSLTGQIRVVHDDLKKATDYLNVSSVDAIVCNPPYFKSKADSRINDNDFLKLARHEITTNLDQVLTISQKLLKSNGRLAMVHRPDRFFEIIDQLRAHNLQPKRIRFVYPKAGANANLLLIDAIKDGRKNGELFLPPLTIHQNDGSYTAETLKIYDRL